MLKNYFRISIRNLLKHKSYSLLNISGLAIGLACCLLILLFVQNELSYDQHHEQSDRIYRVAGDILFGGNHLELAVAPAPMAEALVNDFPEVLSAVRFRGQGSFLIKREVQNYTEDNVVFADNSLFDVFTVPLIAGNPESALKNPNTIIISESSAKKYFDDQNPVGESLILDNTETYQITGVFEDMPANSHFHFDFIASLETLNESRNGMWLSNNFRTYILLQEGTDPQALEAKFPDWLIKYMEPQVQKLLGASIQQLEEAGTRARYYLQPLKDIHLTSNLTAEFEPNGNINYVYIFSAIAVFILLIACINFMNLSTARSANRAREVGIRKVVGSLRGQLIGQFLMESILLSLISMIIAVGLVELFLPLFNDLAEKSLESSFFSSGSLILLLTVTLVVGMLAGIYPAFILSSFRPVRVLKGDVEKGVRSGKFRSALVIFQFAASVILIVGTIVVKNQLRFIQNKTLGFNKEQVIILHDAYALGEDLQPFKNEVLRNPSLISGTVSSYLPVSSSARSDTGFWPEGKRSEEDAVSMQIWSVDFDYIETLDMEIKSGRSFSKEFSTDSSAIIINERAAQLFGFDDPLGQKINTFAFSDAAGMDPEDMIPFTIIGIVKNFHFESLRENISALGMRIGSSRGFISFRFNVENASEVIGFLQDKWQEFGPGQPFAYSFLNERFERMYRNEQRVGEIFGVFSGLAIFTACLGLFGLASFSAEQRTKEIGIRKVLGATVPGIVIMFLKEFTRYIIIAGLIATPISWIFMREWLANFAYRIDLGAEIFLLSTGIALIIAILTVSFQAIKAAFANPANALKYE